MQSALPARLANAVNNPLLRFFGLGLAFGSGQVDPQTEHGDA